MTRERKARQVTEATTCFPQSPGSNNTSTHLTLQVKSVDDVMSGAGLRPAINELRYQTYDNELRYQTRMGDYDEDACV